MRTGLSISTMLHAGVLAAGVLTFSAPKPFEVAPQTALPVDLISLEDFTQITAGTRDGEVKPPEAPEQEAPEAPPRPVEEPAPPTPQPAAAAPPPPPPPPPEPEPEVAPEPEAPPPEPVAEPVPEPTPEPEPQQANIPSRTPLPPRKPRPPVQAQTPQPQPITPQDDQQFNPDEIAVLLDKQEQQQSGGQVDQPPGQTPALGAPRGLDQRLSITWVDSLRQQISRCWSPPVGVVDARGLVVTLDLDFAPDGSLAGPPTVANSMPDPLFQIAAESARRAAIGCQPYNLPVEDYDQWQSVRFNFDPREMLGG